MKPSYAVLIASAVVLALSIITIADSTPPSPPPTGTVVTLGYNGTSFIPMSADPNGVLNVNVGPAQGTLFPALGTAPIVTNTCQTVITGSGLLVNIYFISPTSEPANSTVEIFDNATNTCGSTGQRILYSSGQIGAGWTYHDAPLQYTVGITYQCTGCITLSAPYGFRFRTYP